VIVYNADDARLNRWIQRHQPHSIGYGIDAACDVMGKRLKTQGSSQSMMVQVGRSVMPLTSRLIGDHNARHILGAVAIGYAFGLDTDEIVAGIERLQRIPGRLQSIANPRCSVTIDLADQADRLAVSLHALARNNSAPIVCVAEVPESATAEQLMAYGRVLERAASRVILTQSRVSAANAQKTIWNVLDGCSHPAAVQIVPNRETAIEFALRSARPGDQIMLAGWGSVRWTNNQTRESKSDLDVVEALLAKLECERHQSAASAATNDESSPVARHSLRIFGPA
jgi:UDP-N-acetylmuramoyl-L-alanyl-D-glutamate--2,6-diaminopimelate ligase